MDVNLNKARDKLGSIFRSIFGFCRKTGGVIRRVVLEQFNKNIYTRILFTNVIFFVIVLIVLASLSNSAVKKATYDQVQQELLRKAKRVNYALMQQTANILNSSSDTSAEGGKWDGQETLKFLADIFDVKITVFDREGSILGASAEQEIVPGSMVDEKLVRTITNGEVKISRSVDTETGQQLFTVVIPNLFIGGTVTLAVFIFISVYLAFHISRPISRLVTTVTEISRGSYVLCDERESLDEINALAVQLNKLIVGIREKQAESYRMDLERARLFAETSHELRTPLTAIQGFVEAIRDGMVQDETLMRKYLDTIYTQTVHIGRLVDDIMILSRLESGSITVEKVPIDLSALVEGVVTSMEALAAGKNNTIKVEKKAEDAFVIGDVDRMEQILRNLIKNAVNATENGTITIATEAMADEVVLAIKDNGIGIAPEDLPHIWDRFYRAKSKRVSNMQEKGSGLGLLIVKKLVQLQNGRIDVESQLGKGTTFIIRFPRFNKV